MLAQPDVWPERTRPLKRVEYDALVSQGLLVESRVELLLGNLVEMTPQGPLHADVVAKLSARFGRALPPDVEVRTHSPLAVSEDSEPEPDIAVVPTGDYSTEHPREVLLVVEVADTSLLKDRRIKAALYATAAVPEFWLVNLTEKVVEVHRVPVAGRYTDVQRVGRDGHLTPVDFPNVVIRIADLLP